MTKNDRHKDAEIFAEILRKTKLPNEITIGKFILKGTKGVKDKIQYNQDGFESLQNEHEYTFPILDGDLQVSLQLYENTSDFYRLFCYTKINGKEGMTFSVNLTTEKESDNVIYLTQKIKFSEQYKGSEKLAQGYDEIVLNYTCESENGTKGEYGFPITFKWNAQIDTTWNDIFAQIAPLLISEINEHQIKVALNKFVEKLGTETLKESKNAKGHKFKSFVINEDDYQTIKVQLRALGLIVQSDKKRAVSDKGTYWTLTPYGDTIMNQLRAIKREEI